MPFVPADLVTFTEEILNGKLHFLCSVFSFLGYFNLCTDFFADVRKWFDKKANIKEVNFKIYDVTDWIKNNYNTHIVQYLKK